MAYEQRDNSGTLWKNDRKTSDNHPNAKGDALIDGRWYWVSAWTKRKQDGEPFQSLSFTPKDDTAARPKPQQSRSQQEFDDEIPF
jgi:hypothetical protein